MLAAAMGREDVAHVLLQACPAGPGRKQSYVDAQSHVGGLTALMCAVQRAEDRLVCLLLNHGASIFPVTSDGRSALKLANNTRTLSILQLAGSSACLSFCFVSFCIC